MSAGENAKVKYSEGVTAILNYDIQEGKAAKGRGKRQMITQDEASKVYKEKVITTQRGRVVTEKVIPMQATDEEVKEFLARRKKEIELGRKLERGNTSS